MYSTSKLAVIFLYCLGVLYGIGYVVFFKDASPWWFVMAGFLLPNTRFIARLAWEGEQAGPEAESS
jgi:hypothetical protein